MATDDPDIVATDDEGQQVSDNDVLVNGALPGSGGGGSIESQDDGTTVESDTTVLNLGGGYFGLTNPATGEVKVVLESVQGVTGDLADPQDPKTHATTHQSGGADELAVGDLANVSVAAMLEGLDADKPAAGTAGRYYHATDTELLYRDDGSTWNVKAGHGTSSNPVPGTSHFNSLSATQSLNYPSGASVTTNPSVIDWKEDGNSPLSISSASSGSITLASSWDAIMCIVTSTGGSGVIDMRANGDTGANYDYVDLGGTATSGASQWDRVMDIDKASGQTIHLAGKWPSRASIHTNYQGSTTSGMAAGGNSNVTSPLDSITLLHSAGSNFSVTMRVFGI